MHRSSHLTSVIRYYAIMTAFCMLGFIVGTGAIWGAFTAAWALGLYAGGAA